MKKLVYGLFCVGFLSTNIILNMHAMDPDTVADILDAFGPEAGGDGVPTPRRSSRFRARTPREDDGNTPLEEEVTSSSRVKRKRPVKKTPKKSVKRPRKAKTSRAFDQATYNALLGGRRKNF